MSDTSRHPQVLGLTARIVSAHVSHNAVPVEALPGLIRSVHATLAAVGIQAPPPDRPQPAVPVKRSVFPDHIVCLEDGKKLKMLKRHLRTVYDMTPGQYRARWGLSSDYPMVAPDYAAHRSSLAKKIGLGRHRVASGPANPPPPPSTKSATRGRKANQKADAA